MTRDENIGIFYETLDYGKKYEDQTKKSSEEQVIIRPVSLPPKAPLKDAKVVVNTMKTFDAARKYLSEGKTAALNFASATTPGGGVLHGANAQEECLCRVSNLYPCLNTKEMYRDFYMPNQKAHNALHEDDMIYTPNIVVFRDDDYGWLKEDAIIDVITCAAPNLREKTSNRYNPGDGEPVKISDEDLEALHYKRTSHILAEAAKRGVENIILGAFGCGAFKNPPEVVSKGMKRAVEDFGGPFKNIVFAVYCNDPEKTNYKVFAETMKSLQ